MLAVSRTEGRPGDVHRSHDERQWPALPRLFKLIQDGQTILTQLSGGRGCRDQPEISVAMPRSEVSFLLD